MCATFISDVYSALFWTLREISSRFWKHDLEMHGFELSHVIRASCMCATIISDVYSASFWTLSIPLSKNIDIFLTMVSIVKKKSIWCILCFVLDSTRNLKSFWKTRSGDAWLRIQDTLVQITSIRYCQIIVWHKFIDSWLSNNICFVKQYLFSTAVLLCQRLSV